MTDHTTDAARVVAYRDPNNPHVLLCRVHGQSWHAITPVTAEDLPEGGICTFGRLSSNECGRDVLIPAAGVRDAARQASTQQPDAEQPANCGLPHPDYPETLCTRSPGHGGRHAGAFILYGKSVGGASWVKTTPASGQQDACPACEAGIAHTEHCPTPETHNWGLSLIHI